MNLLTLIQEQIASIRQTTAPDYLDAVKVHLERAFRYYEEGAADSCYYNDVVYRANQAYEGALKEAYQVLENVSPSDVAKKVPREIERYLKTDSIFRDRVIHLFEIYRHEWRNESAHDHKLVIDYNEAFLALVHVSAFVHLLLNLIQERAAYNLERAKEQAREEVKSNIPAHGLIRPASEDLIAHTVHILQEFKRLHLADAELETSVLGRLNAFLETRLDATVQREPKLQCGNQVIRPDFVVAGGKEGRERVIVEINRFCSTDYLNESVRQLVYQLSAAAIDRGILFCYGDDTDPAASGTVREIIVNGKVYMVHIV